MHRPERKYVVALFAALLTIAARSVGSGPERIVVNLDDDARIPMVIYNEPGARVPEPPLEIAVVPSAGFGPRTKVSWSATEPVTFRNVGYSYDTHVRSNAERASVYIVPGSVRGSLEIVAHIGPPIARTIYRPAFAYDYTDAECTFGGSSAIAFDVEGHPRPVATIDLADLYVTGPQMGSGPGSPGCYGSAFVDADSTSYTVHVPGGGRVVSVMGESADRSFVEINQRELTGELATTFHEIVGTFVLRTRDGRIAKIRAVRSRYGIGGPSLVTRNDTPFEDLRFAHARHPVPRGTGLYNDIFDFQPFGP